MKRTSGHYEARAEDLIDKAKASSLEEAPFYVGLAQVYATLAVAAAARGHKQDDTSERWVNLAQGLGFGTKDQEQANPA